MPPDPPAPGLAAHPRAVHPLRRLSAFGRPYRRDAALGTSSLRDELLSILERSAHTQAQTGTPGMPPRRMPVGQGVR